MLVTYLASTNVRAILIIAGIAIFLALPMLIHGPMLQGHDTQEHLSYSQHFTAQFWAGEWFPHWLLGINHGLGSPSFFVYGPLPFHLMALLNPMARFLPSNIYKISAFLALFVSGVGAFFWLTTMVDRTTALVGSALYMLMPYHLAIDFYRRSALPECWGLAWIPLVLYFTVGVIGRKRHAMVGLAFAYALLIFSHLFSVLMLSFLPLAVALAYSEKSQRLGSLFRVLLAMLFGAALSSVYLFTGLFHERFIPAARLLSLPAYDWTANFLSLRGVSAYTGLTHIVHSVSQATLSIIVSTALCGALIVHSQSREGRKRTFFWLATCALTVLIMTKVSVPIWHLFPLLRSLQFPWRFNVLLCVAALPIYALALSEIPRLARRSRLLLCAVVSVATLSWLLAYVFVWHRYALDTPPPPSGAVVDDDGLFPAWAAPGTDQASALRASAGPSTRFRDGRGTTTVLIWKPRQIDFSASSTEGGWVMVNQFYYPEWKARVRDYSGAQLELRPALPEGLVEVRVPPGNQEVGLEIPVSRAERWGAWVSALCLIACGIALTKAKLGSQRSPA